MGNVVGKYYKKDYWIEENLAFAKPHFRLHKCARIVNSLSRGKNCDLLDLGCGPGTLAELLPKNINYYGIDIAIHSPSPNLLEMDLLANTIKFGDKNFDFIVAMGLFEYMGNLQSQKFFEINQILKDSGKFIMTYSNIQHRDWQSDQPWNNVQTIDMLKKDLAVIFHVDKLFASSHNRRCHASTRIMIRKIQMNINTYIPFISPLMAIEYFIICSKKSK